MNANLQTVEVVVPVYDEEVSLAHNVDLLLAHLREDSRSRSVSSSPTTPAPTRRLSSPHSSRPTTARCPSCVSERKGRGLALRTAWLVPLELRRCRRLTWTSTHRRRTWRASCRSSLRSVGAQRARDRHPPRAPRACAAGSRSASCSLAVTTRSSTPASTRASAMRSAASKRCAPTWRDSSCPLVQDDGWFFDTELLLLAERNGMRIHEVPVDWIEDLDSRVELLPTIGEDLPGLWRVRRSFWRGEGAGRWSHRERSMRSRVRLPAPQPCAASRTRSQRCSRSPPS